MGLLAVSGRGLDDVRSRCAEPWEVISLKCLQERYILYFQIPHNKLRLPPPTPPHFAWTIVSYAPRRTVSKSVWKQQLLKNWGRGGGEGEGARRVFYEWFNIQRTNRFGTPESLWKIKRSWSTGPNTGYKWRLSSACPSFDPKIMIKS